MKVLIVGQGLAGTVLSYYMKEAGINHMVMDNNHKDASTLAAAGLINPITGRNYVKSWMIEDLIPESEICYKDLSELLGQSYIKERSIIRSLSDIKSENKWLSSTARPGYSEYFESETAIEDYKDFVLNRMTYGLIKKGFQVNIRQLIKDYQLHLKNENIFISGSFDFDTIDYNKGPIFIEGHEFDKVIFCEGHQVLHNPFFKHLPFQPAKGESLILKIDALKEHQHPQRILRDDIFLVPQDDNQFWSGGGYDNQASNSQPTNQFLDKWTSKLDNLLNQSYTVLDHRAGIRPSVKGRRPLIGVHPQMNHLLLFNGMGTKGTSLAPYWAKHLVDHLLKNSPINEQVDLLRFWDEN